MKSYRFPQTAILFVLFQILAFGQPEVFTLEDFQLRGPVKSCTVITDYGEERFEFDRDGRLTKSITRYSDTDYDITHYRYQGDDLTEKRDEVYRDGRFDDGVSFARFYKRDSLEGAVIIEKITSYDQQIREQLTYQFDTIGRLKHLTRVHDEGIDDTRVEYAVYKGEETASHYLNGQLAKSIRTSEKDAGGTLLRISLVKEYFQGAPQKAVEQVRDTSGLLISETRFRHDPKKDAFTKEEMLEYTYDDEGFPISEAISYFRGDAANAVAYRTVVKEFVYQYDGKQPGNWIRKIIRPDNAFTTRKIAYYSPETAVSVDSLPKNRP